MRKLLIVKFVKAKSDDKTILRDHCHLTGKFRGAAQKRCNLEYKVPKLIPVIFHNSEGYGAHLFIKNLSVTEGQINCIPNNDETNISFTKKILVDTFIRKKEQKEFKVFHEIRFIDSFKFIASCLDKRVSNLEKEKFENVAHKYRGEQLELLMRKGVYPYDYVDCLAKFEDTFLPPKEVFYSNFNDSHIYDEDCQHARKTIGKFLRLKIRDNTKISI